MHSAYGSAYGGGSGGGSSYGSTYGGGGGGSAPDPSQNPYTYNNYDFLDEPSFTVGDIVSYASKNYTVHVVRPTTVTLATRLTFLYDIPHSALRIVRRSASAPTPQDNDDDDADAGLADSLVQSNAIIRRIHKADPDIRHFTVQAAKLVGIAARKFVEDLAKRSFAAEQGLPQRKNKAAPAARASSDSPSFDGPLATTPEAPAGWVDGRIWTNISYPSVRAGLLSVPSYSFALPVVPPTTADDSKIVEGVEERMEEERLKALQERLKGYVPQEPKPSR